MKKSKKRKKNKSPIKRFILKISILLILIGLNWTGLSTIGKTLAYFNDVETSKGNNYTATILDFSLTNTEINKLIGVELGEDIEFISVATKIIGSLPTQYKVYAEKITGDDNFCQALRLEASHSTIFYNGALLSFETATTTDFGTWAFETKLPPSASNFAQGEVCNVDLVFQGWREEVADFGQSGFTDEERIHLHLTSRMIVLNEFLPNPDTSAYGFDFGQDADSMPKGEWVELYNNSNFDFDLEGYYLTDADGHRIDIEPCRTNTGNTIIPAKGFLVVYRNGGGGCSSHYFSLNNNGDTVKLFNNEDILIDSHSYDAHDYCQLEPTPGEENSDVTGGGNCEEVPPNKSYARIPDGIGYWVDPIPTPGRPNELEGEIKMGTEENISQPPTATEITIVEKTPTSTPELISLQESNTTTDGKFSTTTDKFGTTTEALSITPEKEISTSTNPQTSSTSDTVVLAATSTVETTSSTSTINEATPEEIVTTTSEEITTSSNSNMAETSTVSSTQNNVISEEIDSIEETDVSNASNTPMTENNTTTTGEAEEISTVNDGKTDEEKIEPSPTILPKEESILSDESVKEGNNENDKTNNDETSNFETSPTTTSSEETAQLSNDE